MIAIATAIALLVLTVLAVATFASYYMKAPIRLYALAIPVVAFWITMPLAMIGLILAAVEYSTGRGRESWGIKLASGAMVAFLGSWSGAAIGRAVAKILGFAK